MTQPYLPLPDLSTCSIAVIGLGYVGLPLAVQFATVQICIQTASSLDRKIIGFDIDLERITELKAGIDRTNEVKSDSLLSSFFGRVILPVHLQTIKVCLF